MIYAFREVHERPREPAHWDRFLPIFQGDFQVPIIANGDFFTVQGVERFMEDTKCKSLMIARGAIMNPSLFTEMRHLRSALT
jgi:tRNA-dihydrouridine synthase